MAKTKNKTKAELLQEAVAEAVGAGRELHLESVDFSDPNRPKTCLEVDFPILPINTIATIEGKGSGALKPVYQTMKWWARRRSTVFRQLLISAATKAPENETDAAKVAWDAYYGNHQNNEAFRKLRVADIFMGGGTTIVEGSRLGMEMYGNDLNPVAWLVVKNEMAQVDPEEVQALLDEIEAKVKPQIMPFYACDCPRGHKGKWTLKATGEVMGDDFDPLSLSPDQRPEYEYDGPEVVYTFWAKHGPCQATECNHRTPIMTTPVVAMKTLTLKVWANKKCNSCGEKFDIERQEVRMAPAAMLVVAETEKPFTIMDEGGVYSCPHCGHEHQDQKAANDGESASLGKRQSKKLELTLLVHPRWLTGSSGNEGEHELGGSVRSDATSTRLWLQARASTLTLIEVRGKLPAEVTCPDTGMTFYTDKRGGTMPKNAAFTCQESTCGLDQDVVVSLAEYGDTGPVAVYAEQRYCPVCDSEGDALKGRLFGIDGIVDRYSSAYSEWTVRSKSDLREWYPVEEIPYGVTTHIDRPLPQHGFTHWWCFFNGRQLLVLSQLLRAIETCSPSTEVSLDTRNLLLGVFQQYLRNQNMFCFWNTQRALEPMFSNNNFAPKITVIENSVFSGMGRGDFTASAGKLIESLSWSQEPWEIAINNGSSSSVKVPTQDPVLPAKRLTCQSATQLNEIEDGSLDLIVTDPPFGGLLHYSELSEFFYVWLRPVLSRRYPEMFSGCETPKALEAVANKARHPGTADEFYQRVLTECWKEAVRTLKPGGLLTFTFHHSEDEPWVAVLESLFDAGFILEATFPIRSDETKGKGEFGSQQIEFDIVHVCRKRLVEPDPISWARLRRQIMRDVRQLQEIIEQHQEEGLGEADLQVIRRGKALEYFSRHYGKVYIEKGREDEFTVKDALVGINQLLDDESDTTSEAPPVLAEPYTRQFLRLFADKSTLERDQLQKYLRGTGVSPSEFLERGWCSETKKIFTITDPLEWAKQWKGKPRKGMSRDFDQTYFLIGACYDDSGIKASDTLNSGSFVAHPAISDLLTWFGKHGSDSDMRAAAKRAKQIYSTWLAKNTKQETTQRTLFDLEDE